MPNAPAARITDQVKHTEAMSFRRIGAGIGGVLGFAAGVALVGLAVTTEVVTAGMATPLVAVAVYVGAGLVVAGSTAAAASAFSNQGAHIGASVPGDDEGPIITGIDSIIIGPDKQVAAYLGSKALCNRHKHDAPDSVEFVVQGSRTVRLGSGRYPAARVGDKGTCDFKIGHGCDSVIIGGETITIGTIDFSGDDPEAAFFNKLGEYGSAAFLAGTALLAVPAGFVAGGVWGAARAALWAGIKFEATSKLIDAGINHLVPAGPLRDTVSSLATILPLFHGGSEAGGEESGGGTGSESSPASESSAGSDGSAEPGKTTSDSVEVPKPAADSTGTEDASPASPNAEASTPEAGKSAEAGPEGAASEGAKAEGPGSEADPTRPIGDSPGGLRGGEEAESDADAGDEKEETPAEEPAEDKIYRKDRAPESSEGRKPGSRKSFINEDGDLEPANPEGDATVQQHVRGSEPAKSDSSYTSFSDELGTSKDYGGDLITLDRGSLSQDIASGKVSGVEILNHEDVLAAHDGYIADAQARYDANPTAKNMERLNRAQQDRSNSVRDREVLVKGTVPGEYITRTPAEPADGPSDGPSSGGGGPSSGGGGPSSGGGGPSSGGGGPSSGGGGPSSGGGDGPPSGSGGPPPADPAPSAAAPEGGASGDPLVQIGSRDGGMPGEAPPEQAQSGSGANTGEEVKAPAAESNPTVQAGESPGGKVETTESSAGADAPETAAPETVAPETTVPETAAPETGATTEVAPSPAAQAAPSPGRLDYSRGFENDLSNFEPGATLHDGPLPQDMTLVQYHRADAALGDGRSASWWTTTDQGNELSTEDHVRNALALPPDWGPRDAVSTARIPAGTDVTYYEGKAVEQVSTQTGQVYDGGGLQYRFKNFDPAWITQTRPIPTGN